MPEKDKLPQGKSMFQIVNKKVESGEIEILFQMEIDNAGNTTFTVFKTKKKIRVKIDKTGEATDET